MLRIIVASLLICMGLIFGAIGMAAEGGGNQCQPITQVLQKLDALKPGDSRAILERDFELDGGLQFAAKSRYVFKGSHYIKIDVEFSADGIDERPDPLPTDKIVHISKPYLEYPVKD